MPKAASLCLGLCATFFALQPAAAAARCADHTLVVKRLNEIYGESRRAMGVVTGQTVLEVYASDESGSWSITITQPGGPTCLVASGGGFRMAAELENTDPDA